MLIFSVTLFYTGLHQVLWSGVYTTSIGFTQAFGEDKKKIAALCGIFFGAGEVLGRTINSEYHLILLSP